MELIYKLEADAYSTFRNLTQAPNREGKDKPRIKNFLKSTLKKCKSPQIVTTYRLKLCGIKFQRKRFFQTAQAKAETNFITNARLLL